MAPAAGFVLPAALLGVSLQAAALGTGTVLSAGQKLPNRMAGKRRF